MLPFLKKKQDSAPSGLIIKTRTPDESTQPEEENDPSAAHEACGHAILQAIKSNDAMGIASAIQDLLALGDEPNASEAHSYDAQNQEAGE